MKKVLLLITGIALYAISNAQVSSLQFEQRTFGSLASSVEMASNVQNAETTPMTVPAVSPVHIEFKYLGLYGVTDLMCAYDLTESVLLAGLNFSGGWQFSKHTGFGVGVSYLSDPDGVFTQMPLFVELRTHYLRNQLTPFTTLSAGYTLPMGKRGGPADYKREVIQGGMMMGISVGARYAIHRFFSINAYVGYQMHSIRVRRELNPGSDPYGNEYSKNEETVFQNMIKVGFGINF
jgi:hypothetical protein